MSELRVKVDEKLLEEIDAYIRESGFSDRSDFCRFSLNFVLGLNKITKISNPYENMEVDRKKVINDLKIIKKDHSLAQLEQKTGYHSSYISKIISGNRDVTKKFLEAFCEAFNKETNGYLVKK